MTAAAKTVQLLTGDRVLRALVTGGLLSFGLVTQIFVLPTYRVLLGGGGGSVPAWLSTSIGALPWIVAFVVAAATVVVVRASAEVQDAQRTRMWALVDSALVLWVLALGLFFLYGAIAIPGLAGG